MLAAIILGKGPWVQGKASKIMSPFDRLFDVAFIRPPPNCYGNCVSSNPAKNDIDVTLAKEQHREYASILKDSGIEIIELPPLEDYPDSVFIQDPALLGSRRAVIGRFGEERRRGEEKALVSDLNKHRAKIGEISTVGAPGYLEGGDIVVTDRGIFVGESARTNNSGIQQLAVCLNEHKIQSVKTQLLHLLCGCSYLSNGTMTIVPELVNPQSFPDFRFVTLSEEDAYAADALYLGESRVLIPSGYPKVSKKLKDAGYKPIEVEISEFWKGDGGVTCLSSPVYKLF